MSETEGAQFPFMKIAGAALMLRAALDDPQLSDHQRTVAQEVVWESLLRPALEETNPNTVDLLLVYAQVAVLARDLNAIREGSEGARDLGPLLSELNTTLDRLELLAPIAHLDHAARTAAFLAQIRAEVPEHPGGDTPV